MNSTCTQPLTNRFFRISIKHLQVADQQDEGTFCDDCKTLAALASTAVDFSKTGIPPDMRTCPRHEGCKPDFLAPSPRIIIANEGHVEIEDQEEQGDDLAFEGLDAERRRQRYYRSTKVLGKLYRQIDERGFLDSVRQSMAVTLDNSRDHSPIMVELLAYVKRQTLGIQYEHHVDLAKEIRAG